jgi:hypothetical protein
MKRYIRATAKRAEHLIGARWACQLAAVPPGPHNVRIAARVAAAEERLTRLTLEPTHHERFFEALQAAGMREAQGQFSVAWGSRSYPAPCSRKLPASTVRSTT